MSPEGMVVYLGESADLRQRLKSHAKNNSDGTLLASWHEFPAAAKHQLHELETDLIGAFYLEYQLPPMLQYTDKSRNTR
jgi:hypothetical protein